MGAGEHAHRRGLGVPAHPARALGRAVLPGGAAAPGRLRPIPARRTRGPRAVAAHAVRRRPLRRVEDWLAGSGRRPATASTGSRQAMGNLLSRLAQVADVDIPEELAPELVGRAARARGAARWVAELRAAAAERLTRAAAVGRGGRRTPAEVDAELAAARALADRHTRRERARTEVDTLDRPGGAARAGPRAAGRGAAGRTAARRPGGGGPQRARRRAGRRRAATRRRGLGGRLRRPGRRRARWRANCGTRPPGCGPCCPRWSGRRRWRASVRRLDRRSPSSRSVRGGRGRGGRLAGPDRRARGLVAAAQAAAARLPASWPSGTPPGPRSRLRGRPSGWRRSSTAPAGRPPAAGRSGSTPASAG